MRAQRLRRARLPEFQLPVTIEHVRRCRDGFEWRKQSLHAVVIPFDGVSVGTYDLNPIEDHGLDRDRPSCDLIDDELGEVFRLPPLGSDTGHAVSRSRLCTPAPSLDSLPRKSS